MSPEANVWRTLGVCQPNKQAKQESILSRGFTHFAPVGVKDVARAETLMGNRLHAPAAIRSLRSLVPAKITSNPLTHPCVA
jgi:hypothetical protein